MENHNIVLTESELAYVINTGNVRQSALGEAFISECRAQLGIDPVVCYADAHLMLEGDWNRKGDFVRRLRLTAYVRTDKVPLSQINTENNLRKMGEILKDVIRSSGTPIEYTRLFSAEELKHYGFSHRPRSEWDISRIIQPQGEPREETCVHPESFDGVAIWHVLADRCSALRRFLANEYGFFAKVHCGWDATWQSMNHFIFFANESERDAFLSRYPEKEVTAALREHIVPYDKWSLITESFYRPHFGAWDKLSDSERFRFLREG